MKKFIFFSIVAGFTLQTLILTLNSDSDSCVKLFIKKKHWFFCGEVCTVDKKHPNLSKGWHKVGVFLSFQTPILKKCHERAEKCADDVLSRLSSSIDLVAGDAIYHGLCESIFLRKNLYLRQTRPKLNKRLDTPRITQ